MVDNNNSGDISLKELLYKVRKAWRYLLKQWLIILIFAILGGVVGLVYAITQKPVYNSSLSFVLSSSEGSKVGSLSGFAGQLGIDLGGGQNDAFSGDNITTLMTSQRMIRKALFRKSPASQETLINIIAKDLKFVKKWNNNKRTKNCYPFPDDINLLSPVQDSLFKEMYDIMLKKHVIVEKPNKKQSIFVASTTFSNELISAFLPKYLVSETAEFYIATKTKLAKQNLEMLQREADSLRRLLSGTISYTASSFDQTFNLNSAYQVERARTQEGQMKATVVGNAYGEVLKNLEIAKITLQKETPLFQIIDEPSMPLKREKTGKIKALLIGAFLSGFMAAFIIIIRKGYRMLLSY